MADSVETPEPAEQGMSLVPVPATKGFAEASRATLAFLQDRIPFGLWVITRKVGKSWLVLQVEDRGYSIAAGSVLHWSDTLCERMVEGLGPNVAPRVADIPAYAAAPMGQVMPIGAYIGVPLELPDGTLFGTLCGLDAEPKPDLIEGHLPMLRLVAQLLSTIAGAQITRDEQDRAAVRAWSPAETDGLTGLLNRRGWDRYAARAEEHCLALGSQCAAIRLELDGLQELRVSRPAAADELLQRAAQALLTATRGKDAVARLEGDELGVLVVGLAEPGIRMVADRIQTMLTRAGTTATIGVRMRKMGNSVDDTIAGADRAMVARKSVVSR